MGANDNPSIVNDESGNNYGGIGGVSAGQATMQYLENLQAMAMKMPPKPLGPDSYMPGEERGIQQGQVSGSIIGSQPLFAASNLIPFAMMDEIGRSRAESEVNYYAKLKTYLNKPLIDAKIKLSNPVAQPAFANKIQQVTDKMLAISTNRHGGDAVMGRIALQNDPEYLKFLEGVSQYADMYNSVNTAALDTVKKMANPMEFYVSENEKAAVNKFLTTQDIFAKDSNTTFDKLTKDTQEFQAQASVFKLAEAATAHVKDNIMEEYSPSSTMSTNEKTVWIKTKTTGSKKQAEEIYNSTIKATPGLDDNYKELLKKQIEGNVKYAVEKSIDQIDKQDADRDLELKKYGVRVDDQGSIQFPTKPAALVNATGTNAVNYKTEGAKPVGSVVGMTGYIVANGRVRFVKLPESYQMIPQSEYDITDAGSGVAGGRYVESKINFQSVGPYKPDDTRALTSAKAGTVTPYSLGTERGSEEKLPASLQDAITGEQVQVYGEQTILTPFDQAKGLVEGNIPYMGYVHDKLEASYGPYTKRKENLDKGGNKLNSKADYAKPIEIPAGADSSFIKDDPYIKYHYQGKVLSGKEIWDKIGR